MEASSRVLLNDVKPTPDYDVTTHKQWEQSPQWEAQISKIYCSLNRDSLSNDAVTQRNMTVASNSEISTIQRQCLSWFWINFNGFYVYVCGFLQNDKRWEMTLIYGKRILRK